MSEMKKSDRGYTVENVKERLEGERHEQSYKDAFPASHEVVTVSSDDEGPSSPHHEQPQANQEGSSSSQEKSGPPSYYKPHYTGHQPSALGFYYAEGDTWDKWYQDQGYPK
jgi:hypothetical protein